MSIIDEYKELEQKLSEKFSQLCSEYACAGMSTEGDYSIQIDHTEKKLYEIRQKIKRLEEAKEPESWNIKIFVLTNFKAKIIENIPEGIIKQLPTNRNSNEKLELWVPYLQEPKTIEKLLSEFRDKDGYLFEVFYLNGQVDIEKWSVEIDNSIVEGRAVAIIDLLGINKGNEPIARRFDTQKMNSTILPICLELHKDIRNFMEDKHREIFPVLNYKLKTDRCCYFVKAREEDFFIQQLRSIYPARGKTKNTIKGIDRTNKFQLTTSISNFI